MSSTIVASPSLIRMDVIILMKQQLAVNKKLKKSLAIVFRETLYYKNYSSIMNDTWKKLIACPWSATTHYLCL